MEPLHVVGIVIISIIVIAAIGVLIGLSIYNEIITLKNKVRESWAGVIAHTRQKLKLIPKLAEMVKEYAGHESGVFEKTAALRSKMDTLVKKDTPDAKELAEIQKDTSDILGAIRLAVGVENYPVLEASSLYKGLMSELAEAEENITAAITIYNDGVKDFNNAIETWPGSAINKRYNKEVRIAEFSDTESANDIDYKPNFIGA